MTDVYKNDLTTLAARIRPLVLGVAENATNIGGNDGYTFIPAIGGNAAGFFADYRDRMPYGGGPWQGGHGVEFDQAGIPINYPFGSAVFGMVAYGIWVVPNGVSGFIATPICSIRTTAGTINSNFELYHTCIDVSPFTSGPWQDGNFVFGENDGTVPKKLASRQWSNTGSITIDCSPPSGDGVTGFVFDTIPAGDVIMFAAENFNTNNTSNQTYGWFLGWHVQLFP
jgi:hypothetical protein